MNGKKEETDEKKPWDVSNWGLNKEDIWQSQDMISQKHNALSTDKMENETQNNIDSKGGR